LSSSFAHQVALVTVERQNKNQARFEVAALVRGEGERWLFDKIAIGPVTESGSPGDPQRPVPPKQRKKYQSMPVICKPTGYFSTLVCDKKGAA
jgi:hypothetical protein